jgi:dipeptidyl aminopeptidase/acylaminoacyl peptidase
MKKRTTIGALALALACSLNAVASARPFSIDDIPTIAGVGSVAISPDGKSIAFIVSHQDMKADKRPAELELYDVSSKTTRPLTYDRTGLASPAWSPDGTRIAFLANAGEGDDVQQQIFVLDLRGGDARKITSAKMGVLQFSWRPDGAVIAYVTPDEPVKPANKYLTGFYVGDQAFNSRSAPTSNHIWLVGADGSNNKRLTSGTWSIPGAEPPSSPGPPLSWSPDGTQICFTEMPNAYDADSDYAYVAIVDVATGKLRTLTGHGKYEGYGEWSPDGKSIAYWYPQNGDPAAVNEVYVAPATGGNGTDVTSAEIDTNVQRAFWMPDGTLLVSGHKGTDAALWIKPVDAPAKRVALGAVQPVQGYWLDATVAKTGALAFAGSEPGHPVEVYYMASATAVPQRVTGYNDAIAALDLGAVKPIAWSFEGYDENGIVTLPPGYDPAKKYPLVLVIHGGPNSASIASFGAQSQLLAAHGYIVFNPNYRGSDNQGAKYWYGIVNDAGAGPGRDVMAGIDAVEKAYQIDTSRIAVSGWSYGGYMTSWMIGHYHIWKTAVSGAAVNDQIDEYALADNGVGDRYSYGGSPYQRDLVKAYIEQSPIAYAWNVTTPTLILSDTGDARVPITQSYKFYHALKDRGTTVEFWAYPVGGHFPADPVRSQDVYRRWTDWIVQYLK